MEECVYNKNNIVLTLPTPNQKCTELSTNFNTNPQELSTQDENSNIDSELNKDI